MAPPPWHTESSRKWQKMPFCTLVHGEIQAVSPLIYAVKARSVGPRPAQPDLHAQLLRLATRRSSRQVTPIFAGIKGTPQSYFAIQR